MKIKKITTTLMNSGYIKINKPYIKENLYIYTHLTHTPERKNHIEVYIHLEERSIYKNHIKSI